MQLSFGNLVIWTTEAAHNVQFIYFFLFESNTTPTSEKKKKGKKNEEKERKIKVADGYIIFKCHFRSDDVIRYIQNEVTAKWGRSKMMS